MRQTIRSRACSFRKAKFAPCPAAMSIHSLSPVIRKLDNLDQERSKVFGSGCSRSLVLEKGPPELEDFRLFCACFIENNVGKAFYVAKNLAEMSQTNDGEINLKVSDFTKLVQKHLSSFPSPVVSEKKTSNFMLPCTKWSWKKVWDTRIWIRQVPSCFSIHAIALLAMTNL